jgi:hypothetical protein
MKKKVGEGNGPRDPSIHRGDNFSSQQLGSKRKLEGCKPTTLQAPTNQRLGSGPLLFHLEGGVVHKILKAKKMSGVLQLGCVQIP